MHDRSSARARLGVAAIFFANGAVFASWVTRIPEVQRRLQLSEAQLGLALFGVAMGSLVAMPAVGALVARRGSAPVTRVLGLAFCASVVLPALAGDLLTLCLALAVVGAANGSMDVSMNAHAAAVERAHGRPIMASFHALYSAGGLAGAVAGGAVASLGVPPLVHFAGAAVVFAAVVAIAGRALLPAATDAGGARAPAFARPSGALAALAALAFCVLLSEGAIADWSAVFLVQATGASAGRAAWGFGAFSLAMALGRTVGDAVTHRLGPVAVVRGGGVLAAAGLGLGLASSGLWVSVAGFTAVGLGFACIFPSLVTAASRIGGGSTAIAAVATVGYAGYLAGPPLIGLIAQATSVRVGLALVVGLSLVVAALAGRVGARAPAPAAAGEPAEAG
jgi:MFS family permease